MCVVMMTVSGERKRVDRPSRPKFAARRAVCVSLVKAAVRRYTERRGKSHCRLPRTCGRQTGIGRPAALDTCGFPAGAMAPRNTTQYLMELAYGDLAITEGQRWDCGRSPAVWPRQSNDPRVQDEPVYSSSHSDDENMAFQQRDFESVFLPEL